MVDARLRSIFKKGSKTYFHSSLLFPKGVKDDVFKLYAFVRVADDLVDCIPPKRDEFFVFRAKYEQACRGEVTGNFVIDSFADLKKRKRFKNEWVDAFLDAMQSDLERTRCVTIDDTKHYMYGSAEVVGLMMARVMDLPEEAHASAKMLGRAMQYINFIRDVKEDNSFGRVYLPVQDQKAFGLKSLLEKDSRAYPNAFKSFMESQLKRYYAWQKEAENGFKFLPFRLRIAVKTASDMYKWTGERIREDPFIIYRKKVKPSKLRIIRQALRNAVSR